MIDGKIMATTPVFIRQSMPERIGYNDSAKIYKNDVLVLETIGSTCPNPYSPSRSGLIWTEAYGFVALGKYSFKCVQHDLFGKCLLINEGKAIPTVNPNRNHGNKYYACEIFVHCGGMKSGNKEWRGSAGCLTIHPDYWRQYMDCFGVGEKGMIIITDNQSFDADNLITEGL